jgi:isoquinoline 1-oxidoreductase beta subunit
LNPLLARGHYQDAILSQAAASIEDFLSTHDNGRQLADAIALLNRRALLKGATAMGGMLMLSALLPGKSDASSARPGERSAVTAWVRIAPDNSVTLVASQSEMGQGTTTTLAAVLADELYLPLERVSIEFAPFDSAYRDPAYNWMFTGNSQGIASFYEVMRTMGAAAREMLLSAASAQLSVAVGNLTCADGMIHDAAGGRSVSFGDIAAQAARLPVPTKPAARERSTLVGRSVPRWDIPGKVDGSAIFGIDVNVPGMLLAAVRCAPRFGTRLASYDAAKVKESPGIVASVEVPSGLVVVAKSYWQARIGLDAAAPIWSDQGSSFTSSAVLAPQYATALATGPFHAHKNDGDVTHARASAKITRESLYQLPFQAHATMEPMNCTAHVTADRCEIWVPTQGMEMAQNVASAVTGLSSDRIIIHRTLIGGGFGRRLLADFLKQTLIVAMAVGRPVKLIWSREEDMSHDFYRPGMLHRIGGAVDSNGRLTVLEHRVVSPSHMLYIFPRGMFPQIKDWTQPVAPPQQMDTMAVEGLLEVPYAIANQRIEQHRLELDVPVSVWRTTGHGPNNFVLESFIDELAAATGVEPMVFRRSLLAGNPRALRVLDVVADMSGWSKTPAPGVARGVALASAFGGIIAMAVELSVQEATIRLRRIFAAVDCGRTLDPGIAESNILGGIVWGISAMKTAATFAGGAAGETNFDRFDPARLWETPPCEVHFVASGAKPGGTGELGPVPVHAAICNALFAATGKRIRTLPLTASGYSFA